MDGVSEDTVHQSERQMQVLLSHRGPYPPHNAPSSLLRNVHVALVDCLGLHAGVIQGAGNVIVKGATTSAKSAERINELWPSTFNTF